MQIVRQAVRLLATGMTRGHHAVAEARPERPWRPVRGLGNAPGRAFGGHGRARDGPGWRVHRCGRWGRGLAPIRRAWCTSCVVGCILKGIG